MGMPAVITATTFDLNEVHAAILCLFPRGTAAELDEGSVQSVDVLLQRALGLAKGEGDESDGSVFRKLTDASSDMASPLCCAWITKSIFALITRDAVHAGLAVRFKNPSIIAAIVEANRSVFRIVHSFQGLQDASPSRLPTGVSEGDAGIVGRFTCAKSGVDRAVVQRCFEAIKSRRRERRRLHAGGGFKHDRTSSGGAPTKSIELGRTERAVHKSCARSRRLSCTASIDFGRCQAPQPTVACAG